MTLSETSEIKHAICKLRCPGCEPKLVAESAILMINLLQDCLLSVGTNTGKRDRNYQSYQDRGADCDQAEIGLGESETRIQPPSYRGRLRHRGKMPSVTYFSVTVSPAAVRAIDHWYGT